LLKNPFYCDLIIHPYLEEKVIEGKHEPMVSKELFLKVNNILDENSHGYTVKHENEAIPLKNFVKCDHCGASMPGYIVKKKNLWYYKCRTIGCCNNRSANKMHDDFIGLLKPYQMVYSTELTKLIKREVLSNLSNHLQSRESQEQLIRKQLLEINSKIDRIEERFVLEEISQEQFLKFSNKFKEERSEINKQLE
jgi:site-specific DNA recombinase